MNPKQTKEYYNIHSRNRKSLSNSLLMYFLFKEGGTIAFSKTKDCKSSLKVLTGNRIYINNQEYRIECFEYYSNVLYNACKRVLNNPVNHRKNEITITKDDLILIDENSIFKQKLQYRNKIEECRAKEAHFSNTMSFILLTMGYSLTFNNRHIKISNAKYHFYFYESIKTPENNIYSVSANEIFLTNIVTIIQQKIKEINFATISIKNFQNINNCISSHFSILSNKSYSIEEISIGNGLFIDF